MTTSVPNDTPRSPRFYWGAQSSMVRTCQLPPWQTASNINLFIMTPMYHSHNPHSPIINNTNAFVGWGARPSANGKNPEKARSRRTCKKSGRENWTTFVPPTAKLRVIVSLFMMLAFFCVFVLIVIVTVFRVQYKGRNMEPIPDMPEGEGWDFETWKFWNKKDHSHWLTQTGGIIMDINLGSIDPYH